MLRPAFLAPTRVFAVRADVVQVGLLALTLAVMAGTLWGRVRTTGPIIVLAATLVAAVGFRHETRRELPRLVVLLAAFGVAWLLRRYGDEVHAHRTCRAVLAVGLAAAAILGVPWAWFVRWTSATSFGPVGVAILGVGAPAGALYANATEIIWAGDTVPVVATVERMYRAGTRDLSMYLPPSNRPRWDVAGPTPYFVRSEGTGTYSAYPAGMELFAWPGVMLADALGLDVADGGIQAWIEKLSAAALGGACLALFYLLALRFGSPQAAFATAWLLALGSAFTTTLGVLLWQQGGIVFGMLVALGVEVGRKPGWKGTLVQGVACGFMLACRPSAVTFLVPFGLWVLARDWRRGLLLPLAAAVAYAPWAAMYLAIYGNLFGPSMAVLGNRWSPGENLGGILVSPGRGLIVYQPWLVLLVGLRASRPFLAFVAGVTVLHLALVSAWPVWWGGSCYGSRLVAELIPLAGLLVVKPVEELLASPRGRLLFLTLLILSFAMHLPCAFFDAWLWNAWPVCADADPSRLFDWNAPPFAFAMPPGVR